VDGFVDRIADFLKSLFGDGSEGDEKGASRPAGGGFRDPDVVEAEKELDDFMRTGARGRAGTERQRTTSQNRSTPDPGLRQDYANLEVPFGADIETVLKSYKHLMMKYHPDKHSGNAEKQRVALEITKKINESFERIRSRQEP
jgi:DnaJ-domain-containing protein 1